MQYDNKDLDEKFKTVNVGEFFDFVSTPLTNKNKNAKNGVCPVCGYTAKQFLQTGFLGCSECYTNLFDVVEPAILRLFGKTVQNEDVAYANFDSESLKSNFNTNCENITELEEKLKKAVLDENYEFASVLKKKIDKLKRKQQ